MINAIRLIYNKSLAFERMRKKQKLTIKQKAEVIRLWVRSNLSPSAFENEHDLPAKSVKKLAMEYGLV